MSTTPQPIVPYGQPSVTPPSGSFTQGDQPTIAPAPGGGASGQQDPETMKKLLLAVIQHAQQQKQMPTPVPAPIPQGGGGGVPQGAIQKGSGARFATQAISGLIQGGIAQHKAKQLATAESDWNQLANAMQSGNPNAINFILTDDKKLKNMAKALNQDWLNPEKTTVYKQALDNVMKQQQQKQGAAQNLKAMFQKLIHKANNPQLSDQQKQGIAQEIMGRAPTSTPQQDPDKTMQATTEMMKAYADLTRASTESRDKYQFIIGPSGNIVAADKSDPSKSIPLQDDKGNPLQGQAKTNASVGKPVMVNGVPIGVGGMRDGQFVVKQPSDPDWTGQDAKTISSSTAATAASNSIKDRRIQMAAEARAKSYAATREYGVIDSETGGLAMVSPNVINASPGRYAPASQAIQTKNRSAIFDEIDYTSGQVDQAIDQLPETGFDAASRAQVSAVLKDTDPRSALETFLGSTAAETLSDAQVNYITGLVSMQESAMSLRSVGNMGGASDTLRNAIVKMVPGAATPSKKYAQRQMQLVKGEINQYRKAVPKLGDQNKTQGGGGTGPGNVIVVSPEDMK